jgi:uncharacterized protein DUF2442
MKIVEVQVQPNCTLKIISDDGRIGNFDVTPYLKYEVFADLKNQDAFMQISNGGYFIEWECGADLSADTIEARWKILTYEKKAKTKKD